MLTIIISLIGVFLTVCLLIGLHEFGHFIAAKMLHVKVLRFSIGFGKPLFHWRDRSGTEYVVTFFPLGGYVKLLDEIEGPVLPAEKHLAFNRQPFLKRASIICAGPLCNFVFAFLAYWIVFVVGMVTFIPYIEDVNPESIADRAGLVRGQEIVSIDHKRTHDWIDVTIAVFSRIGDQDMMTMTTRDQEKHIIETHTLVLKDWKLDDLVPDPIYSLGIIPLQPKAPAIIDKFLENSLAQSVLKIHDQVLEINHHSVNDWMSMVETIEQYPNQVVLMTIKRSDKVLQKKVKVGDKRNWFGKKKGFLGVESLWQAPDQLVNQNKYSPLKALVRAYHEVVQFFTLNFLIIWKLIVGDISIQSIAGPLSILASAGMALNLGFIIFLDFLGFISASLAAINILPLPGLDGGYFVYALIELITKRPIPLRVQLLLYRLGMIVIVLILFQGLMNDLLRLLQ
jgi:regulator of sigma E protease